MFLTLFAPASSAPAQEGPSIPPVAEIDSSYFHGRPDTSLAICERMFATGEDRSELRWRAARAAIVLGMIAPVGPERRLLYDRALHHARMGRELEPRDITARYWVAAAAGRRADRDDPVYSAKLALEAYELVTGILAEDSSHAGAHHVLGMLHAEVLRAPALVRMVAGRILRMDLARHASPREAERHLRRATELEPETLLYVADLAAFYRDRGRVHEAGALVLRLSRLPLRHPADGQIRSSAIASARRTAAIEFIPRMPGHPTVAASRP